MKKLMVIILAAVVLLTFSGIALATQGNIDVSGPHYNLNLIGIDENKQKNENMGCGSGHRIFVKMGRNAKAETRISLGNSDLEPDCDAFCVDDCDGTDGSASFLLPNPDPEGDGTTLYRVYIRLLGKPFGEVEMVTCAIDKFTGLEVCSDFSYVKVRTKGRQRFENVTKELLYIYAVVNGVYQRVPLFSALMQDYLWSYNNKGAKIAQLRFYMIPDTVPPA